MSEQKTLEACQVEFAETLHAASRQNLDHAVIAARNAISSVLPSIRSSKVRALRTTFPLLEQRILEDRVVQSNLLCAIRMRDRTARNRMHDEEVEVATQLGRCSGLATALHIVGEAHRDLADMQFEQQDELKRLLREDHATSIANAERRERMDRIQADIDLRGAAIGAIQAVFDAVHERLKTQKAKIDVHDPDIMKEDNP